MAREAPGVKTKMFTYRGENESIITNVNVTTRSRSTTIVRFFNRNAQVRQQILQLLENEGIQCKLNDSVGAVLLEELPLCYQETLKALNLLKTNNYIATDYVTQICQNFPNGRGGTRNIEGEAVAIIPNELQKPTGNLGIENCIANLTEHQHAIPIVSAPYSGITRSRHFSSQTNQPVPSRLRDADVRDDLAERVRANSHNRDLNEEIRHRSLSRDVIISQLSQSISSLFQLNIANTAPQATQADSSQQIMKTVADKITPAQHNNINVTQKSIIEATIQYPLDDIIDTLENDPEFIIKSLSATLSNSISEDDIALFKEKNIWESIKMIFDILHHPCPQNRCVNYPYFQEPADPDWIVYKDDNGRPSFERKGLLGLSGRNDSSAPAITRQAVISFIHELVNNAIALQQKKLEAGVIYGPYRYP